MLTFATIDEVWEPKKEKSKKKHRSQGDNLSKEIEQVSPQQPLGYTISDEDTISLLSKFNPNIHEDLIQQSLHKFIVPDNSDNYQMYIGLIIIALLVYDIYLRIKN